MSRGNVPAGTAVVTSVADSNANQTLLQANAARVDFSVFNNSTVTLYLKKGATATTSDFTVAIAPGGFYADDLYTGQVDGIWASNAAGAALITETSQ